MSSNAYMLKFRRTFGMVPNLARILVVNEVVSGRPGLRPTMRGPRFVTRHPQTPQVGMAFENMARLEDKPVVRKCIEQIKRKTGLSADDAKLVLHHMLRQDVQGKKTGNLAEGGASAVSFDEMVQSGEWRTPARTPLHPITQPSLPPPASPSPTTSPPLTPRDDEPLVAHIVPGRASAERDASTITLQLSVKPDGQNIVDLKSSCSDGLMLLSTTAFVYARDASASG